MFFHYKNQPASANHFSQKPGNQIFPSLCEPPRASARKHFSQKQRNIFFPSLREPPRASASLREKSFSQKSRKTFFPQPPRASASLRDIILTKKRKNHVFPPGPVATSATRCTAGSMPARSARRSSRSCSGAWECESSACRLDLSCFRRLLRFRCQGLQAVSRFRATGSKF